VCCSVVPRVTVVEVCCNVLKCVAVCCSVLQCVAVCCSVLQCVVAPHAQKNEFFSEPRPPPLLNGLQFKDIMVQLETVRESMIQKDYM